MTTSETRAPDGGGDWELPPPTVAGRPAAELAETLVEQARAEGVELVGPGGLLGDLTKKVLEAGLEAEMNEHLGYARHGPAGRDGGNSRNGIRTKTVITKVGPVELDVPRDREHLRSEAGAQASTPAGRGRPDGDLADREGAHNRRGPGALG